MAGVESIKIVCPCCGKTLQVDARTILTTRMENGEIIPGTVIKVKSVTPAKEA